MVKRTSASRRIVFLCPDIYPSKVGGMEIFYHHLVRQFSQQPGWEVFFFTHSREVRIPGAQGIYINPRTFFFKRFGLRELSLGLGVLRFFFSAANRGGTLDVACTSKTGFYGYLLLALKTFWPGKIVLQFHGGGLLPWRRGDGQRLLFQRADERLVVSETIRSELTRRVGRPMVILPPLIPFRDRRAEGPALRQRYGYQSDDVILLMLGSIKPLKGNLLVLREFLLLGRPFLQAHKLKLLFAGDGPDADTLRQEIEANDLGPWVRQLGFVPNEQVSEVYAMADVFVMASRYEGTSIALMEAMFNGLPIIASAVSGIVDMVEDGNEGLLFDRERQGALGERIRDLVEDQELAARLGQRARRKYEKDYSYQRVLHQLTTIYDAQ